MARPLWTGSINFGLVTIPIRLLTAIEDKDIHFHMMSANGDCRLRRKLYCPETGKEYEFDKTARGYEIAPQQYVIIDKEEIESLKPESGRSIDIKAFVNLSEVDPIFFVTPYYIAPEKGAEKAYQLLTTAMKQSKRVAIAQFVMRQHEYLCTLRPLEAGILCLETMHFADEIRSADEVLSSEAKKTKIEKKELNVANSLIDSLSEKFNPRKYHNELRDKIEELIESKAEGVELPVAEPAPERPRAKVIDLMKVLERSVKEAKKGRTTSKRRPSTTKRRRAANE